MKSFFKYNTLKSKFKKHLTFGSNFKNSMKILKKFWNGKALHCYVIDCFQDLQMYIIELCWNWSVELILL